MNDLKKIALEYFEKHPEEKRRIIEMGLKNSSPAHTGKTISEMIYDEEVKYHKVLSNARKIVGRLKMEDVTGEMLCRLHHTHGIDPMVVEDILNVDLPSKIHDEYLMEYEKHQETGKKGLKKEEILVNAGVAEWQTRAA